jgi:hypothetical protein
MMPTAEGRDDVFSAILSYWKTATQMIIYDFAYQLAPYCLAREPEFRCLLLMRYIPPATAIVPRPRTTS